MFWLSVCHTLPCRSVATVLKAVCIATNSKVIVKAYYKSKMHPKHYHKLQREIDTMKALNGPYVAEFYSHFEDAQCIYIVMEYCEGGDLFKTMLMHGGLLDEQWVCVEVSAVSRLQQWVPVAGWQHTHIGFISTKRKRTGSTWHHAGNGWWALSVWELSRAISMPVLVHSPAACSGRGYPSSANTAWLMDDAGVVGAGSQAELVILPKCAACRSSHHCFASWRRCTA